MDLNYLFFRQQVERSRADKAPCAGSRRAHEGLARGYERTISSLIGHQRLFRTD